MASPTEQEYRDVMRRVEQWDDPAASLLLDLLRAAVDDDQRAHAYAEAVAALPTPTMEAAWMPDTR